MDKVRTLYCNQDTLMAKAQAMDGVELKLSKYIRNPKFAAKVCFFCL